MPPPSVTKAGRAAASTASSHVTGKIHRPWTRMAQKHRFVRFRWSRKGSTYPYGQSGLAHLRFFDSNNDVLPHENVAPHHAHPVPTAPHYHVTASTPAYGLPSRLFSDDPEHAGYFACHPPFPLWVQLDLGAGNERTITGVEVGAWSSHTADMPRDFTVEGSNNADRSFQHQKWDVLYGVDDVEFEPNERKRWTFGEVVDAMTDRAADVRFSAGGEVPASEAPVQPTKAE